MTLAITLVAFVVGIRDRIADRGYPQRAVPVPSRVVLALVSSSSAPPRRLMHIVWAYYALPVSADIRLDAFTVVAGALACSTAAQMAEIFRGAILAVPRGQWDAEPGARPRATWQRLWWVILPQIVAPHLRARVQRAGRACSSNHRSPR